MSNIYFSRGGPQPLGTVAFDEIEERANAKLKECPGKGLRELLGENYSLVDASGAFMYAGGNAGTHQTYSVNRRAFQKYGIIPRMLVDATFRDIRVSFSIGYSSISGLFLPG